jgi:hypothetical protein
MPRPKQGVGDLLSNSKPEQTPINRGPGYQLSTTNPDTELETAPPPAAPAPEPEPKLKPPAVLRESAKVDKELIRHYKVLWMRPCGTGLKSTNPQRDK